MKLSAFVWEGEFQLPDKEFDCPLSWLWKSILRRVASGKGTYILLTCIGDFMHLSLKLAFVDELARIAIAMYYSRRRKLLQYACEWEIQPTNLILKHKLEIQLVIWIWISVQRYWPLYFPRE